METDRHTVINQQCCSCPHQQTKTSPCILLVSSSWSGKEQYIMDNSIHITSSFHSKIPTSEVHEHQGLFSMKWVSFLSVFQRVYIQNVLCTGEELILERFPSLLLLVPACAYAKYTQGLEEILLAPGRQGQVLYRKRVPKTLCIHFLWIIFKSILLCRTLINLRM